jgi:hypothetical protein
MSDTRTVVEAFIDSIIFSNGINDITGDEVNDALKAITVNYLNLASDKVFIGLKKYIPSGRVYDPGEGVIFSGAIYEANKSTGNKAFDAADWDLISSGGGTGTVAGPYADIPDLLSNVGNISAQQIAEVTDASDDPTVDSGRAFYRYSGSGSTLGDFVKVSEEEAFSENLHQQNTDRYTIPGVVDVTSLKAEATIDRAVGSFIAYRDSGSGNFTAYILQGGTDAESLPQIVRPNDYAASTNEKIWRLAEISANANQDQFNVPGVENDVQLKAIATPSLTLGSHIVYLDTDVDELRIYKLQAGTEADNSPFFIRPDDYAASTNERVWKLVNPVDQTPTILGGNYFFSNLTADADPGDGVFRLNNSDLTLVTEIYIDNLTNSGNNAAPFIDQLQEDNKIFIQQLDDESKGVLYNVEAVPVDATGYRRITVTFIAEVGGGLFDDGNECQVQLLLSAGGSGGGPTETIEHYRFESDLDTNLGPFGYTGEFDVLRIETYAGLTGTISFETALDAASPVFVTHANVAALNAWIDSNVSGDADTGTKWLLNFVGAPDQPTGFDFVYLRP